MSGTTLVDTRTCRAPAVAMHFSLVGDVHACCQNGSYSFGSVVHSSLSDIWTGLRRQSMADHLARGRYPRGCEVCELEHGLGNRLATPAPEFDDYPEDASAWPRKIEFTLSNRCNLQCIQCNGLNSSTIRAKREGRPPLPMPYQDSFFEQLPPFLDHLEVASFLGGEPFLAPEAKRVWDLLLASENEPIVRVTTNATVWNDAVERYVHGLKMNLAVSIDGATKETFEYVRVGATFERVIEIRNKMLAACRSNGAFFHLNYCLLRANWHEVGQFLLEADELDVDVNVIHVFGPAEHSLFTLPPVELERVVRRLEEQDATIGAALGRNRLQWKHLLETMRDQRTRVGSADSRETRIETIRKKQEPVPADGVDWAVQATHLSAARTHLGEAKDAERRRFLQRLSEPLLAAVAEDLREWSGQAPVSVTVEDDVVQSVEAPEWAQSLEPDRWVGLGLGEFGPAVTARFDDALYGEPRDISDGEGLLVASDCVVTGEDGPQRFRVVYAPMLGRMLISTSKPPSA